MEVTEKIKEGMKNTVEDTVCEENTAKAMGSGTLTVYATPAMCALLENAASSLAENLLPPEWSTVGCSLSIEHVAPSPLGAKIKATAEVVSVEGRKITYLVTAEDEVGQIGRGKHERFAILREKFQAKAKMRRKV